LIGARWRGRRIGHNLENLLIGPATCKRRGRLSFISPANGSPFARPPRARASSTPSCAALLSPLLRWCCAPASRVAPVPTPGAFQAGKAVGVRTARIRGRPLWWLLSLASRRRSESLGQSGIEPPPGASTEYWERSLLAIRVAQRRPKTQGSFRALALEFCGDRGRPRPRYCTQKSACGTRVASVQICVRLHWGANFVARVQSIDQRADAPADAALADPDGLRHLAVARHSPPVREAHAPVPGGLGRAQDAVACEGRGEPGKRRFDLGGRNFSGDHAGHLLTLRVLVNKLHDQ